MRCIGASIFQGVRVHSLSDEERQADVDFQIMRKRVVPTARSAWFGHYRWGRFCFLPRPLMKDAVRQKSNYLVGWEKVRSYTGGVGSCEAEWPEMRMESIRLNVGSQEVRIEQTSLSSQ